MKRILIIILFTFIVSNSWATNYYVSQTGAGDKNGTAVEHAWEGWNNINWDTDGEGPDTGVGAGDTLYVIGVIRTASGSGSVLGYGVDPNYLTITGYDSTAGIVSAIDKVSTEWSESPDAYGAYSISYTTTLNKAIEWTSSGSILTHSTLIDAGKDPDGTWVAGNWYNNQTTHILYWKPFSGNKTGKTVSLGGGGQWDINLPWVKVSNLKAYFIEFNIGDTAPADYIWLDGLTLAHGGAS